MDLVDYFVQLLLKPTPDVLVNVTWHRFELWEDDDFQYFGTGAFNKTVFGYGQNDLLGSDRVADELDVVVNWNVTKNLSLQGGYAYMWGKTGWERAFANEDVKFGYLQVTLKY